MALKGVEELLITGNIRELKGEAYAKAIQEALEFLSQKDFVAMEDGRYPINGEKSVAILQRYNTRPPLSGFPEAHKKFVDVQYIVDGAEQLGWCPLSEDLEERIPYDEAKDIIFYSALKPEGEVVLQKGDFAILYPEDVHRPCGSLTEESTPVVKVVVKIAVDYVSMD